MKYMTRTANSSKLGENRGFASLIVSSISCSLAANRGRRRLPSADLRLGPVERPRQPLIQSDKRFRVQSPYLGIVAPKPVVEDVQQPPRNAARQPRQPDYAADHRP